MAKQNNADESNGIFGPWEDVMVYERQIAFLMSQGFSRKDAEYSLRIVAMIEANPYNRMADPETRGN